MRSLARRASPDRRVARVRRSAPRVSEPAAPTAEPPGRPRRASASSTTLAELWRDYRRTRDQHLRDRLILNYAPLVKYVAGRLGSGLPAHVDECDLVSYGLLGLIGAIERFDPNRDIKFETYAISRIKGSIIDELGASIAELDELWTASPVGGDEIVRLIDAIERAQGPEPQAALARTEMREAITEAIARLPEREKLVVTLYYHEDLTFAEIGEVLGVDESRAIELHTDAILSLKAQLAVAPREERLGQ